MAGRASLLRARRRRASSTRGRRRGRHRGGRPRGARARLGPGRGRAGARAGRDASGDASRRSRRDASRDESQWSRDKRRTRSIFSSVGFDAMRRRRRGTRVLVRRGGSAGWSPLLPERRRCRNESRKRSREPRGSPPPRPRRAARPSPRRRGTLRFRSHRVHRRRADARVGGCRGRVAVELGKRRRGSARFGRFAFFRLRDARAVLGVVRALLFLPEVPGSSAADAPRPRRRGGVAARGVARARRARRRAEIFPRRHVFSRWSSSSAERRRGVVVVSFPRNRRHARRRTVFRDDATRRALLGFYKSD